MTDQDLEVANFKWCQVNEPDWARECLDGITNVYKVAYELGEQYGRQNPDKKEM